MDPNPATKEEGSRPKKKSHYFAQKRVLVIGANGSVGRACAMWLLNRGAKVALVCRRIRDIQPIGIEFPAQATCIQCDLVADIEQFDMVAGAIEALGGLDILINCAGVFFENDLESTYPQDHDYLMDINLRSVFHISQLCSISLLKTRGCIVNLSSLCRPQQGMVSYCMSKAGLDMLTKSLAQELAPVRVNAVAPGVLNNKYLKSPKTSEEQLQVLKNNYARKTPMERLGRVDEIVKTIIFLCSKKARGVNGQILQVDGGMHCTSSSFVKWSVSWKMNSKVMPDGLKPINKFASWVGNGLDKIIGYDIKHPNWIRILMEKSNWYTNLPDAHVKIYNDYQKIDEDEGLGMMQSFAQNDEEEIQSEIERQSERYSLELVQSHEAGVPRYSVNVRHGDHSLLQ